jgi:hypothetical protein
MRNCRRRHHSPGFDPKKTPGDEGGSDARSVLVHRDANDSDKAHAETQLHVTNETSLPEMGR